jgi:cbb3-type cytochrome oxidase subunit 3
MNGLILICLVYVLVIFLVGVIFYCQRKNKTETTDGFVNDTLHEKDDKE